MLKSWPLRASYINKRKRYFITQFDPDALPLRGEVMPIR